MSDKIVIEIPLNDWSGTGFYLSRLIIHEHLAVAQRNSYAYQRLSDSA